MDIREAKVAALISIGKAFVVESKAMQDRGIEVMDVHRIANNVVTVVVGLAMYGTWLDTAAGEPD